MDFLSQEHWACSCTRVNKSLEYKFAVMSTTQRHIQIINIQLNQVLGGVRSFYNERDLSPLNWDGAHTGNGGDITTDSKRGYQKWKLHSLVRVFDTFKRSLSLDADQKMLPAPHCVPIRVHAEAGNLKYRGTMHCAWSRTNRNVKRTITFFFIRNLAQGVWTKCFFKF